MEQIVRSYLHTELHAFLLPAKSDFKQDSHIQMMLNIRKEVQYTMVSLYIDLSCSRVNWIFTETGRW